MGNTCSSRRDKDNASLYSEEYTLASKRNSSQDSRIGERRPSLRTNNLQSGVILKVPSAGPSTKPEDSNTYRDSCQQPRKNGSIYGSSQRGWESKKYLNEYEKCQSAPSTTVLWARFTPTKFTQLLEDGSGAKPLRPVVTSQATTPDRNLCLPEAINEISDSHKQLLLGVIPISKPIFKAKKIVIYVCVAEPEERCPEKNILHNKVYPELRKLCCQEGFELHIADLHWKTLLEKRRDHKFPELCIFELNRQSETSYIVPVIFLSNSLGVPLLPKTIDCEDFESTLEKTDKKETLKKWYKLDNDAEPPCYTLQSIEQHIPNFDGDDDTEKEKALKEWNNEVENILQTLVSSFSEELRDAYLTTTIEQEIHNTMRMSQELTKHTIWLNRIRAEDTDSDNKCLVRQESKRRLDLLLNELKNELPEKNIINLRNLSNEEQIKNQILPQLSSVIKSVMEDDKIKGGVKSCYYGVDRLLLRELMIQTIFCQKSAAAHSISNHYNIVNTLKDYILSEDEKRVTVIHGVSGCGKTTVLARLLMNCQILLPNLAVVFRFVNISAESSSLLLLLRSILQQINFVISGKQLWEAHSIPRYMEVFPKLLSSASENRPILIVIDGLDQLPGCFDNITWIADLLPRNIKFILSLNESAFLQENILEKLREKSIFVEVPELKDTESETVLYTLIAESDGISPTQLPEKIRSAVKNNSLPFYIKVIAHHYSWLKNENLSIYSKDELELQLNHMLETLELLLGKEQVEFALALLVAAKYGLTDSEMLDILSHEKSFHSDSFQVIWAPACVFLSEFLKYMQSFMRWFYTSDSIVLHVQHRLMRKTLEKRYDSKLKQARKLLHSYFTGSLWNGSDKFKLSARLSEQPIKYGNAHNTRKIEELPFLDFHLYNSLQKNYLEDHIWLYNKVCACTVYQALEDVNLERHSRKVADPNLIFIQTFLENYAPALSYDGRQFYSQLLKFFNESDSDLSSSNSTLCNTLKKVIHQPPIQSLSSFSDLIESSRRKTDGEPCDENEKQPTNGHSYFDVIKRIEFQPNFIVTVSKHMREIAVWNVTNCQLVRKLINVPEPMALEMIDKFRCVALCQRELYVFDLNTGELLSKLKGYMNQKMPYFGLHDATHVVALSRNRMHVNVMNWESGDLVTSFKAGEDRFLDSLLVSGNGKILVCGDETQKPFPLLVWNLASRKLLYDLRIAHHDFITNLAAITYDGNYVCCVAKEVDEPSPNFIVVYDLQSGTLFKKWKPGVNCVSLDISSKDKCVLSGHQNGTISIWDLITGACKWVLEGHTAPVTRLRLDASGGSFLSTDSSGRDRSIRLWNLTNGELTAVYTPNRTITAAEILSGGQFVVIALEGTNKLNILHLTGPTTEPFCGVDSEPIVVEYGIDENYGKNFDLNNASVDR